MRAPPDECFGHQLYKSAGSRKFERLCTRRREDAVKLERQDQIGILYVDTARNNAINDDFIREAHELMDEAETDSAIRALVVTATHKTIFCPGVDLLSLMGRSGPEMRSFYETLTGSCAARSFIPSPRSTRSTVTPSPPAA